MPAADDITARRIASSLAILVLACGASGALRAHGDGHPTGQQRSKEQMAWGIAGDARPGLRTIRISMSDAMRFAPAAFSVKQGETVRIVVKNDGKLMHEFVLGTPATHQEHAALMLEHPNMEHDEPHMVHVPPGKTGEIVWTFNRAGEFAFACLIAGHYQAGMVGRIDVAPRSTQRR